MSAPKISYELLGPGSFDDEAQDWRDEYVIRRVVTSTAIVGRFPTRAAAREFMLSTKDERRAKDAA